MMEIEITYSASRQLAMVDAWHCVISNEESGQVEVAEWGPNPNAALERARFRLKEKNAAYERMQRPVLCWDCQSRDVDFHWDGCVVGANAVRASL